MSELFERQQYETTRPEYERYAQEYTSPESELMLELIRETNLAVTTSSMLSGLVQGRLLQMISTMMQPDCILEIGTFTGYSAIYLARGLSGNGKLHTNDNNPEVAHIAEKFFAKAGLSERIITHQGNALNIIPTMDGPFDLIFIDADKENYVNYYELVFDKLSPGGIIIVDNVLWYGKVLGSNAGNDKETRGIIQFNNHVRNDSRVEQLLLPVRDGLMMVMKK